MCQLLAMNCNVPTDICFSFEGFRMRGGVTDEHRDGFGVGFFEGPGCRLFLDCKPSCESPVAELIRSYPIRSLNVIAHIRKATRGAVCLQNTHPFMRELWGRYWVFAHNGTLEDFDPKLENRYRPVGDTDSERAFCLILESLLDFFPHAQPARAELYLALKEITARIAPLGKFNYLLSNGDCMFAHCSTDLHYIVRRSPFGQAHLVDQDVTVDFRDFATPDDRVAVIATLPLTDNERWTPLQPGQLVMFHDGEPIAA